MVSSVLLIGGMGYIGSALWRYLEKSSFQITCVDLELFGGEDRTSIKANFRDLPEDYVRSFDAVVMLAGHSSVPYCDYDPSGSFRNNCLDFFGLVGKLSKQQKFIYASSGSVYGDTDLTEADESYILQSPKKPYDSQKQLLDYFMRCTDYNYYGLRFGTVCGYSPNPRNELLVNAMTRSAIRTGIVTVTNPTNLRAVLSINDLCRAVQRILSAGDAPGTYNLASFNMRIGEIGMKIAKGLESKLNVEPEQTTGYSFALNTEKFQRQFCFSFLDSLQDITRAAMRNDFTKERKWDIRF